MTYWAARLFRLIKGAYGKGRGNQSLRMRLYAFFALFIAVMAILLLFILFFTGVFSVGQAESRIFLERELASVSNDMANRYSILSAEGIALSKQLSGEIEDELAVNGIEPFALADNPSCIEPALQACMGSLLTALEKNTASGVFLTLDATVNPNAPGAENSRAGLFLRNAEQAALYHSTPSVSYLRGPVNLAAERDIKILPQWRMEFSVEAGDFWRRTLNSVSLNDDLTKMYYWNPCYVLPGDYNEAMLLCVPVKATDGLILGVCGFEVNAVLFKMQYSPDNSVYGHIFAMLAPLRDNTLDTDRAMLAGNFSAALKLGGVMTIDRGSGGMDAFTDHNGSLYAGLWKQIRLYSKDGAHNAEEWAAAVMMPEQDMAGYALSKNMPILALLLLLLLFAIIYAVIISRRFLYPIDKALKNIVSNDPFKYEKTNIKEIDDLFVFLAEQDAIADKKGPAGPEPDHPADPATPAATQAVSMPELDGAASDKKNEADVNAVSTEKAILTFAGRYEQFLKDLETLTKAQRNVFDLYVQDYTAEEIAGKLDIAMSTIKTHNRNILSKLGVTSRKEMMVYVNMMKGDIK